MSTITINSQHIQNQTLVPQENKTLTAANEQKTTQALADTTSFYDIYGLKEGFSEQLSHKDKVTLSPAGLLLAEAQQKAEAARETWKEPSKLLEGSAEFTEAFKEVESEDGGLVFRRFNNEYLNQLQTVPDALLLYEKINRADSNQIVITSAQDLQDITMKLWKMAADERYKSIENSLYKTSELFDAKTGFTELLAAKNPALNGINFEFSLEGNEIMITGGTVNGVEISAKTMADIEKLANGKEGKELKQAMLALREESINYYNKYTEAGRTSPLSINDFDQRFGSFNSYLESFKSVENNYKFTGPDDPDTYREAYFSGAAEIMAARLAA